MRKINKSTEYESFYNSLKDSVKDKIKYVLNAITEESFVNTKFVKKLVNTPYYEMRITMDNEYRVILFPINDEDFNKATEVYLLNGFVKKSNKDYKKQINKADNIVNSLFER